MSVSLSRASRSRFVAQVALLASFLFLLPLTLPAAPFAWHDESLFENLEQEFLAARHLSTAEASSRFEAMDHEGRALMTQLSPADGPVPEELVERLETLQFEMGAIAAAQPTLLGRLQRFAIDLRQQALRAARHWRAKPQTIHRALYRLIYGGRVAVEEAWLQSESSALPSLVHFADIPSATPSTIVKGVRVHSGDILLSRAGAPTSALISRGNDFRGKFSHVALLYVDAKTKEPLAIEAHIEAGVVVSTLEQYLEDQKQRIVVLRLRADLPKLSDKPGLAHAAASYMLSRARNHRIAYDFAMNYRDDSKLFCSEVVYHAYRHEGINLWQIKTLMTQPGLRAWLADMGVKSFKTLAPSDIEYDPQLAAVAEWRDLDVLREDRIDSAIMDALLEQAEKGLRLGYPLHQLPLAGTVKLWSELQPLLGLEPTIPAGMSVTTALRVNSLKEKVFPLLRQSLKSAAKRFREQRGYAPPYWSLMQLSRQSLIASLPELSPQLVRREPSP